MVLPIKICTVIPDYMQNYHKREPLLLTLVNGIGYSVGRKKSFTEYALRGDHIPKAFVDYVATTNK